MVAIARIPNGLTQYNIAIQIQQRSLNTLQDGFGKLLSYLTDCQVGLFAILSHIQNTLALSLQQALQEGTQGLPLSPLPYIYCPHLRQPNYNPLFFASSATSSSPTPASLAPAASSGHSSSPQHTTQPIENAQLDTSLESNIV